MVMPKKTDNNQRVLEVIKEGWHTKTDIHFRMKGKPKLTSKQIGASLSLLAKRNEIFSREINKVTHYYQSGNKTVSLLASKPWNSELFLGGSEI